MLIEELLKRLDAPSLPAFDPKVHAAIYKAQPKERRRVVSALVRAGGEMEYARLISEASTDPEAIRMLCDLGLITALPSLQNPQSVVLPLERLFATPLMENDPDKLVEALKVYPRDVLWAIASKANVVMDGADENTLRARLFHHATTGRTLEGLPIGVLKALQPFRTRGWIQDGNRLFKDLRLAPPAGRRSAETLFASLASFDGMGDALLRMLVIPVRISHGDSYYHDLAVPRELRDAVKAIPEPTPLPAPKKQAPVAGAPPRPAPKQSPDCVAGRKIEFTTREGRLSGDLARFLLLVDQDPPSVTQQGELNRLDLRRLAKRGGIPEDEIDQHRIAALSLDAMDTNGEETRLSDSAAALLDMAPEELARRLLKNLPSVTFKIPYTWFSDSQFERITKLTKDELEARLRGTEAVVCIHCVKESLAASRPFLREVRGVEWVSQVAGAVLNALGPLYHFAGAAMATFGEKGLLALKPTRTGAAALGNASFPNAARPKEEPLIVQPSGEIIAPRSLPFEDLRRIARSCDVKGIDAAAVFALNRKSLVRAAQRGEDLEALRALLDSRSKSPVPQTVKVLFDELAARTGEIEILPCSAVVKLRSPALLQALGPGATLLSEGLALLPLDADPRGLEAALRKQGYLPRWKETASRRETPSFSNFLATGYEDIWTLLDDALEDRAHVDLRLRGGRHLAGRIESLDDEFVDIQPIFGGPVESVSIRDIASAQPILR